MKNVLVITIGNSDIQINKYPGHGFVVEDLILKKESCGEINLRPNRNYNDYYLLLSSRNDGLVISESYDLYKEILEFPLIEPLLAYFKKESKSFQEVWWVYTDQQKEVEYFQSGDTLYYKQIIQKYFESNYQDVIYKDYPITENVKNIDAQYVDFYSKALALINNTEPISNIFLLPQGGIDQINQALTLQLIQLFKDKVRVFQCAEKSEVVELMFPHLFLKDLTKKNRIKHLLDYDFDVTQYGWHEAAFSIAEVILGSGYNDHDFAERLVDAYIEGANKYDVPLPCDFAEPEQNQEQAVEEMRQELHAEALRFIKSWRENVIRRFEQAP